MGGNVIAKILIQHEHSKEMRGKGDNVRQVENKQQNPNVRAITINVKRQLMFSGYKVSEQQNEKVLEICCTTMHINLTLLNCTIKSG